jgi:hypothetical protein
MPKLPVYLGLATGAVALVLVGFLVGSWKSGGPTTVASKPPEEETKEPVKRSDLPGLPPPPPPVKDEVRVREELAQGATYQVNTRMAFSMRGTDTDWAIATATITVNYWADAEILRKIERNDGKTIVEERTFKKIKSGKLETNLVDVRIELGTTGDFLLGGVLFLQPEALPFVAGVKNFVQGPALRKVLGATGLAQTVIDHVMSGDEGVKVITKVSEMEGKVVRLTYRNDRDGEILIEPVRGGLTNEQRRYLASSVLLADSLIFPDVEVRRGENWQVNAMYFIGLIDPSLMTRPEGTLTLQRGSEEKAVPGVKGRCVPIVVVDGEMSFRESNSTSDRVGNFRPTSGEMFYSPEDHIIVEGHMKGRGKLNIRAEHHLLFETRSEREPDLDIHYTCRKLSRSS